VNSGKTVIVGILVLALGATGLAWWHQRSVGRRALEYWGPDNAWIVRHGETSELLRLRSGESSIPDGPQDSVAPTLKVDEQLLSVARQVEITKARGILHARQALIVDASFAWDVPPSDIVQWDYAVRFKDPRGEITLLFDLDNEQLRSLTSPRRLRLTNAGGFRIFFEEQFETNDTEIAEPVAPDR